MIRSALLAVAAPLVLGLAGCSPGGLSTSELQEEVRAKLERSDSDAPAEVQLHCDGGLAAEVGAERDCTALSGSQSVGLRVRATQTDPLRLDVAPFLSAEALADQIVEILTQEGRPVDDGTCAEALTARPESHVTCQVWTDGQRHDIEAWVTAVDGLMIDFGFEEAE